jgi:TPP-dependent pyruvate/acetoin dehydrogenase alpha subunit
MTEATARARTGDGPQLVVAKLLRLAGHGTHDDAAYVSDELKSRFGDCLHLYEHTLRLQGATTPEAIAKLWEEARAAIATAVAQALSEPQPDAATEDWCAYAERDLLGFKA